MKYVCVWSCSPENWKESIKLFKQQKAAGASIPGFKLLGRWHEVGTGKGYSLIETDDLVAMSKVATEWSALIDQKIVPVVDDEEILKAYG